jgi:hypothetical protein
MPRLVQAKLPLGVDEAMAAVYGSWSEDMLLANVRNQAMASGYLCYHTRFSLKSSAGFPDLVLVGGPTENRLIFAELKRQGKAPTEGHFSKGVIPRWIVGQREWLKALERAAAEVYWWWPSDVHDIGVILTAGPRTEMECVKRIKDYLGVAW